jgi:DNA polymerase phi
LIYNISHVSILQVDAKEFEKLIFPLVKSHLSKPWQEQDLDSLYLLFEIKRHFPKSLHSKFLKNNLGTAEILCKENLQHICSTLTVSVSY